MPVALNRLGRLPIRRLSTGLLLVAAAGLVLAIPPRPAAAEVSRPTAPGSCFLPEARTATFPAEPAASLQPTPANGSVPACPVPKTCSGNPAGYCTSTDLGPCCTSGGATLCCPAGTTLKVDQCLYSWVSGVVGRRICFDLQLTCE